MTRTIIQLIKACASKLRGGKLQRLGGKEISENLEALRQRLGFQNIYEVMVFVAIFDKTCLSRFCDLDDLAGYFDCPQLDVMEFIPDLRSLLSRGMLSLWNPSISDVFGQSFCVPPIVKACMIEDRMPSVEEANLTRREFDRYDLCRKVDQVFQDSDFTIVGIMQTTRDLEDINSSLSFVKNVKDMLPDLQDRALFYELCYDFYNKEISDFEATLKDMYESFGALLECKRAILNGSSPLVRESLVELSVDRSQITLADAGQRLLLEGDYESFGARYDGKDRYTFAGMVRDFVHDRNNNNMSPQNRKKKYQRAIERMENSNPHITCLKKIRELIPQTEDRTLFYLACSSCPEGVSLSEELSLLLPIRERIKALDEFKGEKHNLQKLDFVEMRTESSIFGEYNAIVLTDKGKRLYFEEDADIFVEKVDPKELICHGDIAPKQLFFSGDEQRQLSMVGDSLRQDNYISLVDRLGAKGLSKGIAVLLYGAPGTGKTESVLQWARETGRDVVHVDLSASKSMWYGESEKIVKGIFTRYRNQCRRSAVKPILLFNEADGLFSKRKDISDGRSVDQTENTIQNIILEEMEKLDGILIATTNLQENLDAAFERRFLFKIKLDKPSVEAKSKIWDSKLPSLNAAESQRLAENFDFSGGEIDNIVRKATMQEVLSGKAPDMDSLMALCREEKISSNASSKRIGF